MDNRDLAGRVLELRALIRRLAAGDPVEALAASCRRLGLAAPADRLADFRGELAGDMTE